MSRSKLGSLIGGKHSIEVQCAIAVMSSLRLAAVKGRCQMLDLSELRDLLAKRTWRIGRLC